MGAAGGDGRRNDDRVLLRAKARLCVALLEVHCVPDAQSFEAVDLLRPDEGPLRVLDRRAAATLPRFAMVLAWIYPLPHYWRLTGGGHHLPDFDAVPAEEIAWTFMEIERAGATVLADARTLCGEQVSDKEFSVLGLILALGWRALVPPGVRAPALDRQRMERDLSRDVRCLVR